MRHAFTLAGTSTSHAKLASNTETMPLSFGRVGTSVIAFVSANGGTRYYAMVVAPDGTVRYLRAGGSRDTSFGSNGIVQLAPIDVSRDVGKVRLYGLPEGRLLAFVNSVDNEGRTQPTFYRLWL